MQTKQQMLASPKAKRTYKTLQALNIPVTICRGTSGNEINFFYSDLPYWSDSCLGWVRDAHKSSKICAYCKLAKAPEVEFPSFPLKDEVGEKSRDISGVPGQSAKPSKPRPSELPGLHKSSKHRDKSAKSNAVAKAKKEKTNKLQKGKKGK